MKIEPLEHPLRTDDALAACRRAIRERSMFVDDAVPAVLHRYLTSVQQDGFSFRIAQDTAYLHDWVFWVPALISSPGLFVAIVGAIGGDLWLLRAALPCLACLVGMGWIDRCRRPLLLSSNHSQIKLGTGRQAESIRLADISGIEVRWWGVQIRLAAGGAFPLRLIGCSRAVCEGLRTLLWDTVEATRAPPGAAEPPVG